MALPAALRLTLAVTLDGTPVPGFPVERRLLGSSLKEHATTRSADGEVVQFTPTPITDLMTAVLLTPEQPVVVALSDQDADAVGFDADGLLLLAGTSVGISLSNPGTTIAPYTIRGLVA